MKRRAFLLTICLAACVAVWLSGRPTGQRLYYRVAHQGLILEQSRAQGVSPYLVASVIFTESRFRAEARSEVGAVGLMQLMPETAQDVASRLGITDYRPSTLSDPQLNIIIGVAYLKELQQRFRSPELTLAAYNAGPSLVDHWIAEGRGIPYPETQSFVDSVLRHQHRLEQLYPEWLGNSQQTTRNKSSDGTL